MRLLNTHDYSFKEFSGNNVPTYAILSHRWEEFETSYQDARDYRGNGTGSVKVDAFCDVARRYYDWVWWSVSSPNANLQVYLIC